MPQKLRCLQDNDEDVVQPLEMPDDLPIFLCSAGLLILYLLLSAATEMGTKLPWKK
ncbi:MAG: hypothetical protein KME43_09570 [Myxacorys chilensis ATA2-1-KO14]|nr:hypothetical protein [Myxacorys chilensis ATA2-1-KO14]